MSIQIKLAGVILLLILSASTAFAISLYLMPEVRMSQASGLVQESLVKADSFDLNGNKKVNSVSVILNNTDSAAHIVNVYVSIENSEESEIGSGSYLGYSISAGATSEITIYLSTKPNLANVVRTFITVKEMS